MLYCRCYGYDVDATVADNPVDTSNVVDTLNATLYYDDVNATSADAY
jgi:hypothetical protein